MRSVAVLALPGTIPYELGMPGVVFGLAEVPGIALPDRPYEVRICATRRTVRSGLVDLRVPHGLDILAAADTVVVPGITDVDAPIPDAVYRALRAAVARGATVASICSGAFVLGAAGLLDGRRATTHWRATDLLAERYPAVKVDANALYVDDGQILTSAGLAAGLDLCLHLVRRDYGGAAASHAARLTVAPLVREGGQAQFIMPEDPASDLQLAPLLEWMAANLQRPLDLTLISRRAGMSTRSLVRHFRGQTGTTPLQWLLAARVRRAQALLETSALSVEAVARRVGFESVTTFRARFRRVVGTSPLAYRRAFGAASSRTMHGEAQGSSLNDAI